MKNNIKAKVLKRLQYSIPNAIHVKNLISELDDIDQGELEKVLSELENNDKITITSKGVKLTNYEEGLIRKYIKIGGVEVPRILATDIINAESINIAIEKLAEYSNTLEDKYKTEVEKEMKSFWSSLIILFGIFVSIFTLFGTINNSLIYNPTWSMEKLFLTNMVYISPLFIILISFIILLYKLFK